MTSTEFSFIEKDFQSTTGKRSDARCLRKRLGILLRELTAGLSGELLVFTKSHVTYRHNYGSNEYEGHASISLDCKSQETAQFRVSINHGPFDHDVSLSIGLWMDKTARKFRQKAKSNIETNKTEFLKLANSLKGFAISVGDEGGNEHESTQLSENFFVFILPIMDKLGIHASVMKRVHQNEAICKGDLMIEEILSSWKQLLPLYNFLAATNCSSETSLKPKRDEEN